ncbi:hypothetical protein QQ045_022699 [Rhodiola kirilowii]
MKIFRKIKVGGNGEDPIEISVERWPARSRQVEWSEQISLVDPTRRCNRRPHQQEQPRSPSASSSPRSSSQSSCSTSVVLSTGKFPPPFTTSAPTNKPSNKVCRVSSRKRRRLLDGILTLTSPILELQVDTNWLPIGGFFIPPIGNLAALSMLQVIVGDNILHPNRSAKWYMGSQKQYQDRRLKEDYRTYPCFANLQNSFEDSNYRNFNVSQLRSV